MLIHIAEIYKPGWQKNTLKMVMCVFVLFFCCCSFLIFQFSGAYMQLKCCNGCVLNPKHSFQTRLYHHPSSKLLYVASSSCFFFPSLFESTPSFHVNCHFRSSFCFHFIEYSVYGGWWEPIIVFSHLFVLSFHSPKWWCHDEYFRALSGKKGDEKKYIYIYTHIFVWTYVYMYICVCVCTSVYIYTYNWIRFIYL